MMARAQGSDGSPALRRFLGWASVVTFIVFVSTFTVAAVYRSGLLGALAAAIILVIAAFLWPWATLQNNHLQLQAIRSNSELMASAPTTGPSALSLPANSSGAQLMRRHMRAVFLIGVLTLGGAAVEVLNFNGVVPQSLNNIVLGVGIWMIMAGIFWAAFFRWFYQRPLDAATIMAGRPGTMAWSQYVTTGLQAFIERGNPNTAMILHNGYVLITPAGLEFWQREAQTLNRIFTIARAAIIEISPGVVTDQLQQQQCVYLSIPVKSGPDESVPVLIKGIFGGPRAMTKAPAIFIQTWTSGNAPG